MRDQYRLAVMLLCCCALTAYGQKKEFTYDGEVRSYVVYEPTLNPNPTGYPLVIGLHGAGSDGVSFIATAGLAVKSNQEKFIIAAPDGLKYNLVTWWNAGGFYENITGGTDDLGFIEAMMDTMIANYNIDTTRIYIMGFSNGSYMAYRVAAQLSLRIAAIGVVSGQMVYEYCNPELPVPIIHFHGLSDSVSAYAGSSDTASLIPSVDSVLATWRGINNCSEVADTVHSDAGIVGRHWASQDGNSDIILYTNEVGEHEWPRPANWGISATNIMWDFLKTHSRAGGTGIEAKDFTFDGERRTYLVYNPLGKKGQAGMPLLIGLHCHTGTAPGLLTYTNLLQKVQSEGAIGVFPNGLRHPIGTAWNAGNSFEWMTQGTDDVGFISALMDTIIAQYNVDTTRMYVTGHSNGAMMSYRLAAELSHRIAAIGCVAAPMVYEYCNPQYPVPLIHFHGLADTTCPYSGIIKDHITIPPVDSALELWRSVNGCNATPAVIYDNAGILGKRWSTPDGSGDIELYTIESCMHQWPHATTEGIAATDVIWEFMMRHTRTATTGIEEEENTANIPRGIVLFPGYPNPAINATTITYAIPRTEYVTIRIFNALGQEVGRPVEGNRTAGRHHVTVNTDGLINGLYFCRLEAEGQTATRRLVILK